LITIRCTRKLLRLVGGATVEDPPAPTSALGDWYANVVPTVAGELIVFASERTLLSVALPMEALDSLSAPFVTRVYNLLRMIGVPEGVAAKECAEMRETEFGRTASRSVLGSLHQIGLHYQLVAERDIGRRSLSLSDEELILSQTLHKPLDYVYPADVARELLAERYGDWERQKQDRPRR